MRFSFEYTKRSLAQVSIYLLLCPILAIAGETSGGTSGGGGNQYEEVFFTVAGEAIDNLTLFSDFHKIVEQAETIFENQPKLTFVDQLTDCKGEAISEPGQYAYSCRGEIRLIKKYWKMWLANKFQAQAHVQKIFHETLRVTSYSDKKVTNDVGFRTTNQILKVTDLLSDPKCTRSYTHLMPAEVWTDLLKVGVVFTSAVGISNNELSAEIVMDRCKLEIPLGKVELNEYTSELSMCRALAQKYNFIGRLKDNVVTDLGHRGKFVTAVSSRQCIGSEKSLKNY